MRQIKNQFAKDYAKAEYSQISDEELEKLGSGALYRAAVEGDEKTGDFLAGQISGMINKEQPAAEIIQEMFQEAEGSAERSGQMGKIAFVFAGQGAQYSGMGQSLCEMSPAARAVFDVADKLRPGTSQQCFTAPVEELSITENTQPCLYCVDPGRGQGPGGGRCAGGRGGGLLPGGDCRP